jgi:alcohol dehydrogenase class IV
VRDYQPAGYPAGEALVPHGMAVALTAPEAFRFTFYAAPERHLRAAQLLDPSAEPTADPADQLPTTLIEIMRDIGLPAGVGAVGFTEDDIGQLVDGALKQQRLLATAPRRPDADELAAIFRRSLTLW